MDYSLNHICHVKDEALYFEIHGQLPPVGSYIYTKEGKDKFLVQSISFSLRSEINKDDENQVVPAQAYVHLERMHGKF